MFLWKCHAIPKTVRESSDLSLDILYFANVFSFFFFSIVLKKENQNFDPTAALARSLQINEYLGENVWLVHP